MTGFTYVADNGCVMIPEEVQACPNGYVMEGGRCQLTGQACPAGETWRDGSCQARDEMSCPAGQERVNGSCFQITDTICPVGYSWNDSETRCRDNNETDDGNGDGNGDGGGNSVSSILTFSDTTLTVEEGCDATYTVALKSKPSGDVTVTIGDPSNTDATAVPATLTFTPDNWYVPQTVTVTCTEDDNAVEDKTIVTHTVGGGDYEGVTAPDLTLTVTDNDTAGVTISETTLPVHEGSTGTYTITLDTQPTDDVTVTINDPTNTVVTADPAFLTFTDQRWNVEQTVTVTAKEDDDAVNDTAAVTHTVDGADYVGLNAGSVTVWVIDNETAGLTISADSVNVNEVCNETYTIKLDSRPTTDVTVTIGDPSNPAVTADPATLIFTPDNWDEPQTVTATCTEDDNAADEKSIVTHTVEGGDYEGVIAPGVTFNVTDNDIPGVTISKLSLTVGEGGTGTYTVELDTKPTANVTVTINDPTDNTDVTTDPATMTFTTQTWNNPKTVTVTAKEDDDPLNDDATVTHSVGGDDYEGVTAANVAVTVTDNDTRGVTISESSLTIGEGGTDTYTVKLDTLPTDDVTVTINDPTDNTDVTTDPATMTFTTQTWKDTQTVTVTTKEDLDSDNDTATVTHSVSGADYGTVTAANVSVTVTDNDATATQQNLGGLSDIDSTATTIVNVTATLDSIYTTFTAGDNVWHLLRGSTSIEVEAYWWQDSGSESGDTQILPTEIAGFETICLTVTPDANKLTYAIDQDVALPAEPENAESGVWKLRLKVEWGAVEAGLCNAASPVVPPSIVPALNAVYPWEE